MTDRDFLTEYVRHSSESAFQCLVERHVHLVFSIALREVGNFQAAQDVTQNVFITLARKASSLQRRGSLSGWLFKAAQYEAKKWNRTQVRRGHVEKEASAMQQQLANEQGFPAGLDSQLDAAIGRLREADRAAIVLRYFQRRSFKEIASEMEISVDAAEKRVGRAVQKVRRLLAQRGVSLSEASLVTFLSGQLLESAPVGLAASITAGASAASALTSLIPFIPIMTAKLKTTLFVTGTVVAALTTVVIHNHYVREVSEPGNQMAAVASGGEEVQNNGGALPVQTGIQEGHLIGSTNETALRKRATDAFHGDHEPASTPAEDPLEALKRRAMDVRNTPSDRLAALRELRDLEERTPEVVRSMVQWAQTVSDPRIRADIFRQLEGVTDPVLKQALINGLLNDSSSEVREEAAETLARFQEDPNVVTWLERSARSDKEEEVRRQAALSLQAYRNAFGSIRELEESILNPQASDWERYYAMKLWEDRGAQSEEEAAKVWFDLMAVVEDAHVQAEIAEELVEDFSHLPHVRKNLEMIADEQPHQALRAHIVRLLEESPKQE